jgi:hypothetical protein
MTDEKTTGDAIAKSMASREEVSAEEVAELRRKALECNKLPPCFQQFLLDEWRPRGPGC